MMTRKLIFTAFLYFVLSQVSFAQDDAKKLSMPSSPAFSILGFEPTAVMKPTSDKDLATDIMNSFDKDGKLLPNLGLEFSPYWLRSNPDLTREKYLNPDLRQTFLQSFNLSGATVKDSTSGINRMGVGFRFKVLNGNPVPELKTSDAMLEKIANMQAVVKSVGLLGDLIPDIDSAIKVITKNLTKKGFSKNSIDQIVSEGEQIATLFKNKPNGVILFADSLVNRIEVDTHDSMQQVAALTQQRLGFVLEFAGASSFNPIQNGQYDKIGLWVNASNYVSATDLYTLTARMMNHKGDTSTTSFDLGFSYLKKSDKYNISVEYMLRWFQATVPDFNLQGQPIKSVRSDFSYRLAVQGSYLVSSQISFNLSIGRDFDSPLTNRSAFFSIIGLNYSIFNQDRANSL